jgi:hypothetical protein
MSPFKQTIAGFGAGLLCVTLAAAAPKPDAAMTADALIAHNVEARGGAAKLNAITTLERSGLLVIPGFNVQLKMREIKTRAGQYRQEVTLQGLTQIQAYDGHQAWQVQPFQGRKDPALMSADEAKGFALASDIDLPFVDYKKKGHEVEYLGLEDIDGTPAHKLRVRLKWGDESIYWIDPDTWMVIRELDRQTLRGAEQWSETDLGEYERVAGVWVPMTEEQGPKDSDSSQKSKSVYDKADANHPFPASEFAFPATAAHAAAPEARP